MLKGYENRFITLQASPRRIVRNVKTGWELILAKTYPGSEQMTDYNFQNPSANFPPTVVNISRQSVDAQRAERLGVPYHTNADRDAFRLKHGQTFRVGWIGDKTKMQTDVWSPETIAHFAALAFVVNDRVGWYENEAIKPDLLEFYPVNWDEANFKTFVHS